MNHSRLTLLRLRPLALLAACALGVVLPLRAETDGSIRKTFDVTPGGKLVVDVSGSRVDVQGTTGSQVVIEYTRIVSADSPEEEARILKERAVTLTQTGNTVSLVEQRAQESSNGSLWKFLTGGMRNMHSQFRVSVKVPTQFSVDLRTSGGGIELANVAGQVTARTSGGSLAFRDITGNIEGRTSGGGIQLKNFQGDAELGTSGGGITTADGTGRLSTSTSGGGITITGHSGPVTARTSGGGIRLALTTAPNGENRLSTSGGGITVTLPADSHLDIDASTSGGNVSTDLPVTSTTTKERNRFVGSVNGGGSPLHLRTSGGSIHISADAPAKTAAAGR